MRRPRPKFKVSFYSYFCCFWINVTQINFENIKRKIQRIISDTCFQLKLWFNVDARAPSIPLLNFPLKYLVITHYQQAILWQLCWMFHNLLSADHTHLSQSGSRWPGVQLRHMTTLLTSAHRLDRAVGGPQGHSWHASAEPDVASP